MAYIPEDAKWYLAWLVEELTVEDEPGNIIHTNLMLVRADSPDEAYDKAIEIGKESETSYENNDGKIVKCVFRGLNDLVVIYDELEHGAELSFEKNAGMSNDDIEQLLTPRELLTVFRRDDATPKLNYISKEIAGELERRFGKLK